MGQGGRLGCGEKVGELEEGCGGVDVQVQVRREGEWGCEFIWSVHAMLVGNLFEGESGEKRGHTGERCRCGRTASGGRGLGRVVSLVMARPFLSSK